LVPFWVCTVDVQGVVGAVGEGGMVGSGWVWKYNCFQFFARFKGYPPLIALKIVNSFPFSFRNL